MKPPGNAWSYSIMIKYCVKKVQNELLISWATPRKTWAKLDFAILTDLN